MECIDFKERTSGTLLGYADLLIPKWGVELHGCGVHLKNGNTWVNLPSRKYESGGEEKWAPIMKFVEKEHAIAFSKKALEVITAWRKNNQVQAVHGYQPQKDEDDGVPF